ncbi:MAG: hydantoinase B/oxoprolinase family protein [Actinobacteria bacterium]|nr:hydantoinase B/oxoprolinase family protein [Actinomycetota bacterium]
MDPVTLEVTRNALVGIAEETGAALRRTAYSPNIKERADCSTALFDPDGAMVAQAEHIPVHLGAMPASVAAALESFGALAEGEQVLVSDPFAGGTHLPDWTLVAPVWSGDRLLGFVATRAHHADVGGAAPGSMPAGATEIFAEGLRIPPIKLVRGGEVDRDLLALLTTNSRTPRERTGDLRAQVGANHLGARRVRELAARLGDGDDAAGIDLLLEAMSATQDHAERAVRAAVSQLPDGTYRFEDVLDDDGIGDQPIPIRVAVTVDADRITMDFAGTAPQCDGPLNAPVAVTRSCCFFALRAVVAPGVPANAGGWRPLEVRAPEGSLVDPRPPAAVAAGNVETSQRIVDALFGALAQAVPDRVPAASQGTMNNTLLGGTDPRTGEAFAYYETLAGGQGARPHADGMSGVHTHMTNTKNTPIEAFELAYPVRVVEYRLRDGSGGTGRFRGGDGLRRTLEVLGERATCSLVTERRRRGPWGLAGGHDGAPGRNRVVRRSADGHDEERDLPAKITLILHRGDRIVVDTPGGGGFGAPS